VLGWAGAGCGRLRVSIRAWDLEFRYAMAAHAVDGGGWATKSSAVVADPCRIDCRTTFCGETRIRARGARLAGGGPPRAWPATCRGWPTHCPSSAAKGQPEKNEIHFGQGRQTSSSPAELLHQRPLGQCRYRSGKVGRQHGPEGARQRTRPRRRPDGGAWAARNSTWSGGVEGG